MNRNYRLPAKVNRKIGLAMHDYSMLSEGDRVLVAVSGGVDSLVLAAIMKFWQRKTPISFVLKFCHIDHGFWRIKSKPPTFIDINKQLVRFNVECDVVKELSMTEAERSCYLCAKNRRCQLFNIARAKQCNKICFGHHKDDVVETFLLNTFFSGNISTMVPKQDLFDETLSIIRPLVYLDKEDIEEVAESLELVPVENLCGIEKNNKRELIRNLLTSLYETEPGIKESIFSALKNIRSKYLL